FLTVSATTQIYTLSLHDALPICEDFRRLLARAPELAEMVGRCLQTGELYRREEATATLERNRARRLGVTVAPIEPAPAGGSRGVDRKSTRLNSSHSQISYAVVRL